jgi:hypothetical protein
MYDNQHKKINNAQKGHTMKKTIIATLFVGCVSASAFAYDYPWKVSPPFEISDVDGYKEVYQIGEPIVFHVEGKSAVHIDALPENGFGLAATIYDVPRSKTIQSVAGKYDENRRTWMVNLTAPKDNAISYEIELNLLCNRDESKCAEIYGIAAQTSRVVPLQVQ